MSLRNDGLGIKSDIDVSGSGPKIGITSSICVTYRLVPIYHPRLTCADIYSYIYLSQILFQLVNRDYGFRKGFLLYRVYRGIIMTKTFVQTVI